MISDSLLKDPCRVFSWQFNVVAVASHTLCLVSDLEVGGAEASSHALVVEHLDLEGEVLVRGAEDERQEGQLDAKACSRVWGAADERGSDVRSTELDDTRLDL